MTEENNTFTFRTEEIFSDLPDDPENVQMTIPPEVADKAGLQPGDPIKISIGDRGTVILEKINRDQADGKE